MKKIVEEELLKMQVKVLKSCDLNITHLSKKLYLAKLHPFAYWCNNLFDINQGSPTLLLESYSPADFSFNPAPTHLSEGNKEP